VGKRKRERVGTFYGRRHAKKGEGGARFSRILGKKPGRRGHSQEQEKRKRSVAFAVVQPSSSSSEPGGRRRKHLSKKQKSSQGGPHNFRIVYKKALVGKETGDPARRAEGGVRGSLLSIEKGAGTEKLTLGGVQRTRT